MVGVHHIGQVWLIWWESTIFTSAAIWWIYTVFIARWLSNTTNVVYNVLKQSIAFFGRNDSRLYFFFSLRLRALFQPALCDLSGLSDAYDFRFQIFDLLWIERSASLPTIPRPQLRKTLYRCQRSDDKRDRSPTQPFFRLPRITNKPHR
jgi:hypothetical protein